MHRFKPMQDHAGSKHDTTPAQSGAIPIRIARIAQMPVTAGASNICQTRDNLGGTMNNADISHAKRRSERKRRCGLLVAGGHCLCGTECQPLPGPRATSARALQPLHLYAPPRLLPSCFLGPDIRCCVPLIVGCSLFSFVKPFLVIIVFYHLRRSSKQHFIRRNAATPRLTAHHSRNSTS